jgi:hypothetical protein
VRRTGHGSDHHRRRHRPAALRRGRRHHGAGRLRRAVRGIAGACHVQLRHLHILCSTVGNALKVRLGIGVRPGTRCIDGAATGGASAGEPAEGRGSTGDTADAGTTDGTDSVPTPGTDELTDIVHLLTASDASDAEKEKYLESTDALIVPQTVSRVGLFRAPRGGSEITGPVERDGDTVTAHLNAWSQGIPDVSLPITFVYRDGTWRLSSASVCTGVRTVGLPVYCNA